MSKTRRKLVTMSALAAIGLPCARPAWPQAPAGIKRIGWITNQPFATTDLPAAFFAAMRERGWVEGTHFVVENLYYDSRFERIPGLAAELVQRRVDVIVVSGSPAVGPVMRATSTIPIVFLTVGDPVGSGFVSNLARPGGNVTGLGGLAEGLIGKSLQLLKQAVPHAQRIGVLINPDFSTHNAVQPDIVATAQRLGMQLRWVSMRTQQDMDGAFTALAAERPDAVMLLGQPFVLTHRSRIAALALEHRLPMYSQFQELTHAGVLMSYGWRIEDEVRRLPYYLDRILKGTPPGDLPVEQPTRFYLVLNRKTATALGLTLPQSLLLQATEVVE
jgi:putative ABC transport system substrate-binding protein